MRSDGRAGGTPTGSGYHGARIGSGREGAPTGSGRDGAPAGYGRDGARIGSSDGAPTGSGRDGARIVRGGSLAVLGLILLCACGDREPPALSQTRDSAGVAVTESWTALWDAQPSARWGIDTVPSLDLTRTGSGALHEFHRVVGAAVLADGRIVVANDGTKEVRVYDPDGRALAAVGGEGQGPGEYERITELLDFGGDSIAVFSWPDRLTVLAPDLTHVRTRRIGDNARSPRMLGGGGLVAVQIYPSVVEYEGAGGMIREPVPLVRLARDGELVDTLWEGPGFEEYMHVTEEGGGAVRPLFGKALAWDARDSTVVVGTADAMAYEVLGPGGGVRRIVRVPSYDLSLDPATVEAERATYLGDDPPPSWRDVVEALPAPGSRPAYSDLLLDAGGFVWAGEHLPRHEHDRPRRWDVFAPDGRWLGALHTPSRFRPLEIGRDRILGVRTDELDVEHVQVLRLDRDGRPPP